MNDMKYLVKVSQFVNKTFALWVIIFGILGFIFPEIFKLVGPYVPVLLGVVMFGMGLTLSTADFREVVRRPKEVLTGVVAQFTIMPISAYALCVLLNLPADVAVGMMLLGCAPGGTASNVVTFIARGDVALSVTALHANHLHLVIGQSVLQTVADDQKKRETLSHLMRTTAGMRSPHTTHLVKHPVLRGIQTLQMLLRTASLHNCQK